VEIGREPTSPSNFVLVREILGWLMLSHFLIWGWPRAYLSAQHCVCGGDLGMTIVGSLISSRSA